MVTLYDVKPAFQACLRPLTGRLAAAGVTANQVTVLAAVLSVGAGALMAALPGNRLVFLALPAVLLVRMALNAIDGMLAREFGQASKLGMYLNELADVVSDLALILPFALVAPFTPAGVIAFAVAAVVVEFAGVLGIPAGIGRSYAGPLGKSDRALALGVIAVLVASGFALPAWLAWLFPLLTLASFVTIVNRVRAGLAKG
ncbi:CDP-alcohol phosphatidyltransferase family protein [Arvimicrobium flavum]|uniref:CDP-alcohol phosphatidyltransferase family protein n=1 Tax=Arvimicrobium flavum TaxID=3393320 RepID=UPI00237BD6DE|nr:CDP-alcohol phosphatidyltransferase family protein [Mesorhizobium shangrilense]